MSVLHPARRGAGKRTACKADLQTKRDAAVANHCRRRKGVLRRKVYTRLIAGARSPKNGAAWPPSAMFACAREELPEHVRRVQQPYQSFAHLDNYESRAHGVSYCFQQYSPCNLRAHLACKNFEQLEFSAAVSVRRCPISSPLLA